MSVESDDPRTSGAVVPIRSPSAANALGLGRELADELFPAALAALTKPLPRWDALQSASYAFKVIGILHGDIQRERERRIWEGMPAAAADIYAHGACTRLVERLRAVGLTVPVRTGEGSNGKPWRVEDCPLARGAGLVERRQGSDRRPERAREGL